MKMIKKINSNCRNYYYGDCIYSDCEKISDSFSVEFMIVLLCRISVSVGAVVIKYRLNQKKK